jgi:hypothetical protein
MTFTSVVILDALLDFGIVAAVAAIMYLPFTLDRVETEASVYDFAAPLPERLAA